MKNQHNGGFTLVELIIAIATGSLVFFAASVLLLLGLRINNMTTGTSIRQNTANTVLTVLERMASEGKITKVISEGDSWEIMNSESVMFSYSSVNQAIYTGKAFNHTENSIDGNPIMVDVYASHAVIDENGVLTLAIETQDGTYQSAVYCRTLDLSKSNDNDTPEYSSNGARGKFLDLLNSQYRMKGGAPNPGVILDEEGISTGVYYTEWYIGAGQWGNGWNKDTPWCCCYIAWALDQMCDAGYLDRPADALNNMRWYANVDEFMTEYFTAQVGGSDWLPSKSKGGIEEPKPGDIIFFDWMMGNNPAHVGVVLRVKDEQVYTIEGNSAGMIAVRQYPLNDKRIIGYGVLNWRETQSGSDGENS